MYITYDEYSELYNDLTEQQFQIYGIRACLEVDSQTTGIDGYKKLRNAFPIDEDDARAVKLCIIELAHTFRQIDIVNANGGLVEEDGAFRGKQIASVSSGSESITYKTGNSSYEEFAINTKAKRVFINSLIRDYLSGIKDLNDVNLLYMGAYPYVWE